MQTLVELINKYTKLNGDTASFECDLGGLLDSIHIQGCEWFAEELKKTPLNSKIARSAYLHIAHKSMVTAYLATESDDINTRKDIASLLKDVRFIPKLEVIDTEFPHFEFWSRNSFFKDIHLTDENTSGGDLKIIEWFVEDLVDTYCTRRIQHQQYTKNTHVTLNIQHKERAR